MKTILLIRLACYIYMANHSQPRTSLRSQKLWFICVKHVINSGVQPRWYVNNAPHSLAHCHGSVVWWAATGNNTPCRVPGANPGPSAWQACDLPLGHGSCIQRMEFSTSWAMDYNFDLFIMLGDIAFGFVLHDFLIGHCNLKPATCHSFSALKCST